MSSAERRSRLSPARFTRSARGATSRSRPRPRSTGQFSITPPTNNASSPLRTEDPGTPGSSCCAAVDEERYDPEWSRLIGGARNVITIEIAIVLIAEQTSKLRILEHVDVINRLAVDIDGPVDEPDAVAVIDVPVDVAGVQRLDRRAIGLVPAVDRGSIGFRIARNQPGDHDILLDARYQSLPKASLAFDNQIVVVHRDRAVAKRIHGNRLQLYCGCFVDIINDFSCRQKTMKAVCNELSCHWREWNSGK